MCLSWAYFFHLGILAVLVLGTIAIFRILIPWICRMFGYTIPGEAVQIFNIIIIMIVVIAFIALIAAIVGCLWSVGAFNMLGR